MVVDHRWLVAAEDRMGLRARSQAELDGATGRKVLARDDVEHELQILVPVSAFLLRGRRARNIKGKLHNGAIDAVLAREDARKLHMIALQHQDRVGEKEVDQGGIPHQVPARFRLGLEAVELPAREGKAGGWAERLAAGAVGGRERAARL